MLTRRMLALLHARLAVNAPQHAGSHEYLAGLNDAIAAVRRLVAVASPDTSMSTYPPEGPAQTRLAGEYLQLEMTSLLSMIDTTLSRSHADAPHEHVHRASLSEARGHLVRARAALGQPLASAPEPRSE